MDNTKVAVSISQVIRQRILDAQAAWDAEARPFKEDLEVAKLALQNAENVSDNAEGIKNANAKIESIKKQLEVLGPRPRFHAADNIAEFIHSDEEHQALQDEVAANFQGVLNAMVIDTDNDHNTNETAKRVAKMYVREVFRGRYDPEPKITEFPNDRNLDEVIVIGPFKVRSACSHHFVPIMGSLWIGIKPGKSVAGLSKYGRLAEWILARPHIQEEAVIMLADELEKLVDPAGLIVSISAAHMCMSWRGIKDNAATTTTVVRGDFRKNPALKKEFFDQVRIMQNDKGLGI